MLKQFSIRRSDVVALTVLGAFITGVHGAALHDLLEGLGHTAVSGQVAELQAVPTGPAAPVMPVMRHFDLAAAKPLIKRPASATKQLPAREAVAAKPRKSGLPVVDGPIEVADVKMARALYQELGYGLDEVKAENAIIPRVFLASVPNGIRHLHDVTERKSLFLRTLLPLVLKANDEIAADRKRVGALLRQRDRIGFVSASDAKWLNGKAREYGLKSAQNSAALLKRIDIIPPSLALAQAAEESGWGTSRFARQGNALFGQWTRGSENGIVPLNRDPDKTHVIKAFPTLMEAVRAYARNLNVHRAYADFRNQREAMRRAKEEPQGFELAKTLLRYSERGTAYIETLHVIMRVNQLASFDSARLADAPIELASLTKSTRPR